MLTEFTTLGLTFRKPRALEFLWAVRACPEKVGIKAGLI